MIKCSKCGSRISITWLFLGLPWSEYSCTRCGSIYAGTILRFVLNTIAIGVIGYFAIRMIKGRMTPLLMPPMVGLILVLFLVNLPWQIKKVGDVTDSGDSR